MTAESVLAPVAVHRIVVGVDGSSESLAALRSAIELAKQRGSEITAVQAWQPATVHMYAHMVEARESAERSLRELLLAHATEGITMTPVFVEGAATETLLDNSKDADLLVVGSRGRGGFASLLLGSVSTQCVHHAGCDVLVVRAPAA